jgi:drug/metabolite transporter (DMT)-like permease
MMNIAFLMTSIVLVVYSNLMVKSRAVVHADLSDETGVIWYIFAMFLDPWAWTAYVATGLAAVIWLLPLRQLDLGVAQPAFALVFVAVPLAAAGVLGEPLPPLRIAGLVFIVAGVLLVAKTA